MKQVTALHALIIEQNDFNNEIRDWNYYRNNYDWTSEALYIFEDEEIVLFGDEDVSITECIRSFIDGIIYTGIKVTEEFILVVVPFGYGRDQDLVQECIDKRRYLEAD